MVKNTDPKNLDRKKLRYIFRRVLKRIGEKPKGFFKFRKMLVVNPENGKAMVVVVGDAGPAEWTGKHLGGSPEVMSYLERQDGGARGPVLYYFLDDPQDTIPLGPVSIK